MNIPLLSHSYFHWCRYYLLFSWFSLVSLLSSINPHPNPKPLCFKHMVMTGGWCRCKWNPHRMGPPIYVCWFINHERTPFLYYIVISTMFSHASRYGNGANAVSTGGPILQRSPHFFASKTSKASLASVIPPGHVVGGPRRELLAASVGPVTAMSYVESWEPWVFPWGKSWERRGSTLSNPRKWSHDDPMMCMFFLLWRPHL